MALVLDELSVWDIGFRWAGYDPDAFWLRIPLLVKDNFRLLLEAILSGEVICSTLCLDKLPVGSKADPSYYIRSYLYDIEACIHGRKYDRKLLKWATVERMELFEWCSVRGIPPPEFWFPVGWKLHYESPPGGPPGFTVRHVEPNDEHMIAKFTYNRLDKESDAQEVANDNTQRQAPLRANQLAKAICQQIARVIWSDEPDRTIASVVKDPLLQKYGGGAYYEPETVREWVKVVAPPEVRLKRGRPPNQNGGEQ